MGRRLVWSSENREIAWISLPLNRALLSVKERGEKTAKWGKTTHDTVYMGIESVPWDGLPMISRADKAKVLTNRGDSASTPDEAVPVPNHKIFDADRGLPLYWAERKPVEFWEDILWSLDAAMVVDLTPGSGATGRACLRRGIQYVACCRTEAHAAWVCNILDRESCKLITESNSPLFETDLASLIEKHFEDVLRQLEQQQQAEYKEPDEDIDA